MTTAVEPRRSDREALDLPHLIEVYLRGRVRRGDMKPATAGGVRPQLHQFADSFGARPVTNVTELSVLRWAEGWERLAPATRRNHWSNVSRFLDWLALEGHIKGNPCRHMRAPKVPRRLPRALPPENVGLLLDACPDTRARLIVLLMVQCGCRRAEVANLEVGDVSLSDRTINVVGKGGHQRLLPVPAEAWTALMDYLRETGAATGPLLRSEVNPHRGISVQWVGRIVTGLMLEAGIKGSMRDGTSAHSLRHTAATDMLRAGAHLRDVQHALGHAHLVTTERYLPNVVHGLAEAMEGRRYGCSAAGDDHGGEA